jgi:hypothetical protein
MNPSFCNKKDQLAQRLIEFIILFILGVIIIISILTTGN